MKTIWPYPLALGDAMSVYPPEGSVLLAVAWHERDDELCAWFLVDPERDRVKNLAPMRKRFLVVGTGHPVADEILAGAMHVATVQARGFVWHVFRPLEEAVAEEPHMKLRVLP